MLRSRACIGWTGAALPAPALHPKRIPQCHFSPDRQIRHDDVRFGAMRYLHFARLERAALADEHDRLAVMFEERLARQVEERP